MCREAVEELAHPPDVGLIGQRRVAEHIHRMEIDTIAQTVGRNIFLRQRNLLRQIQNSDVYRRIITAAANGPFAGISAHVVQFFWCQLKDMRQCRVKSRVRIIVIEGEPTAARRFG